MIDKKQIAEALRLAATYLGSGLHDNAVKSLERQANALDPPYKLDRSLRGWVMVRDADMVWVWLAVAKGLQSSDDKYWDDDDVLSWDDVERNGWKVEKLNVLQPGEVAVTLEPVKDWPEDAAYVWAVYVNANLNECGDLEAIISREDAERMEAE